MDFQIKKICIIGAMKTLIIWEKSKKKGNREAIWLYKGEFQKKCQTLPLLQYFIQL